MIALICRETYVLLTLALALHLQSCLVVHSMIPLLHTIILLNEEITFIPVATGNQIAKLPSLTTRAATIAPSGGRCLPSVSSPMSLTILRVMLSLQKLSSLVDFSPAVQSYSH